MNVRNTYSLLEPFMKDSEVQNLLQINRYKNRLWFNKETSELLLKWMYFSAMINFFVTQHATGRNQESSLARLSEIICTIQNAAARANYQVEVFIEYIKEQEPTSPPELGTTGDSSQDLS